MGIVDWFEDLVSWFQDISFPDMDGFIERLNLEPGPLVIAFIMVFLCSIMMFDNFLIYADISGIPFVYRLIVVLLIGPASYIITKIMINR